MLHGEEERCNHMSIGFPLLLFGILELCKYFSSRTNLKSQREVFHHPCLRYNNAAAIRMFRCNDLTLQRLITEEVADVRPILSTFVEYYTPRIPIVRRPRFVEIRE